MVLVLSGHNSTIKVLELYSSLTLRTQRFHLACEFKRDVTQSAATPPSKRVLSGGLIH